MGCAQCAGSIAMGCAQCAAMGCAQCAGSIAMGCAGWLFVCLIYNYVPCTRAPGGQRSPWQPEVNFF